MNGARYERNLDEIELYSSSMAQWTTTDHNSSLKIAQREIFNCCDSKQCEFLGAVAPLGLDMSVSLSVDTFKI